MPWSGLKPRQVRDTLKIRVRKDFNVSYDSSLPRWVRGKAKGFACLSQTWTPRRDALTLELAGSAGTEYELAVDRANSRA